jgi:TMEM175 potassium channel family protein
LQLFLISLLPFTTAVLGRYPDEAAAVILYGLHLEGIGLAQYAHWVYVRRNPHLATAVDPRIVRAATRRLFIGPVAFALAMVIALFSPRLGYAVYFAALIAYIAIAVRDRTVLR